MRVRLPNPSTTGGRMRKLTKILCWPYGSLIRFLSIEKIEGYGIFFISRLFTMGYHNILWFDEKKIENSEESAWLISDSAVY